MEIVAFVKGYPLILSALGIALVFLSKFKTSGVLLAIVGVLLAFDNVVELIRGVG